MSDKQGDLFEHERRVAEAVRSVHSAIDSYVAQSSFDLRGSVSSARRSIGQQARRALEAVRAPRPPVVRAEHGPLTYWLGWLDGAI